MKSFTEIAQANVDHYNNHPIHHAFTVLTLGVAAVVVSRKLIKRIVREDPALRSGQYA